MYGAVEIPYKDGCLLYSPLAKKIARIKGCKEKPGIIPELERNGFFRHPEMHKDLTVRITLIATTDCNLRCRYCYAKGGDSKKYMPLWLARKAMKFGIPKDAEDVVISFFGGEPTLNFGLIKGVIKDLESSHTPFMPIISTNGVISDDALNFLVKKNFIVKLSVDGPPAMQDKNRVFANGKPTSSHVERTIKTLCKNGIHVRVRVTLTKETLSRTSEIIDYLASLGVKTVHLEAVSQRGRAKENNFKRLSSQEYVKAMLSAINQCKENKMEFINSSLLRLFVPSTHYCTSLAGKKLIFTPDGLITSCLEAQDCNSAPPQFILGRYVPEKGTFECNWSKTVPNTINIIQKCQKCSLASICCGGCPIRNFSVTGKISEVDDWQCKTRKNLIEKVLVKMYDESSLIHASKRNAFKN